MMLDDIKEKEEKLGLELSDVEDHNVNDGLNEDELFDELEKTAAAEEKKEKRQVSEPPAEEGKGTED